MKLPKTIRLIDGTILKAGTDLKFSAEGFGYYQGKKLKKVGASVELDVSFPPKPAMELNDTDVLTMTIDWNLDESIIGSDDFHTFCRNNAIELVKVSHQDSQVLVTISGIKENIIAFLTKFGYLKNRLLVLEQTETFREWLYLQTALNKPKQVDNGNTEIEDKQEGS